MSLVSFREFRCPENMDKPLSAGTELFTGSSIDEETVHGSFGLKNNEI